jgi:ArsR family transcriptional regulator, arsenate/arsenite/antimonite-responsive transcriptional repressor
MINQETSHEPLENDLAKLARAIGHPARVALIVAIAKAGGEVFGEIIAVDPLAQGTVIQHLRDLKRSGLIGGKLFGTKAHYWLEKEKLQQFSALAQEFSLILSTHDATGSYKRT